MNAVYAEIVSGLSTKKQTLQSLVNAEKQSSTRGYLKHQEFQKRFEKRRLITLLSRTNK